MGWREDVNSCFSCIYLSHISSPYSVHIKLKMSLPYEANMRNKKAFILCTLLIVLLILILISTEMEYSVAAIQNKHFIPHGTKIFTSYNLI